MSLRYRQPASGRSLARRSTRGRLLVVALVGLPTLVLGPPNVADHAPAMAAVSTPQVRVAARFPAGSRQIQWRRSHGVIAAEAGRRYTAINGLDYADPIARGLVHQVSGRAPRTATEIALTRSLARAAGLRLGDPVRTSIAARPFRLVGIVADAGNHRPAAYTLPIAVPLHPTATTVTDARWLIGSSEPISRQQQRSLDDAGYVPVSSSVYLSPPPMPSPSPR